MNNFFKSFNSLNISTYPNNNKTKNLTIFEYYNKISHKYYISKDKVKTDSQILSKVLKKENAKSTINVVEHTILESTTASTEEIKLPQNNNIEQITNKVVSNMRRKLQNNFGKGMLLISTLPVFVYIWKRDYGIKTNHKVNELSQYLFIGVNMIVVSLRTI